MKNSRRTFIKKAAFASTGLLVSKAVFSASSYRRIMGSNDRVRVGVVGFSDRHKSTHVPCFMDHYKEFNFDIVAVSDIWNRRRNEGAAIWKEKMQHDLPRPAHATKEIVFRRAEHQRQQKKKRIDPRKFLKKTQPKRSRVLPRQVIEIPVSEQQPEDHRVDQE